MSKTLGLDLGTNSIGWCLIEDDKKIISTGVRIFPVGVNQNDFDKLGKEVSKNVDRRTLRGARRRRNRLKIRQTALKTILANNKMLPSDIISTFDLYQLRQIGLDKKIPLVDFGRVLMMLNKRRGFKSNRKNLKNEETKKEESVVKDGINSLQKEINDSGAKTVGEYFAILFEKSSKNKNWHNQDEAIERIRKRWVGREMYINEFNLLWDKQKKYYTDILTDKLKTKIGDEVIFYQRNLKSQKGLVGHCRFEVNKRCAPKSSVLFQEFRIRKTIANIRFANGERIGEPLSNDQKEIIFQYLNYNNKITKTDFKNLLNIPKSQTFNDVLDMLIGNTTHSRIVEAIGIDFFKQLTNTQVFELYHLLCYTNNTEKLIEIIKRKIKSKILPNLTDDQIQSFSDLNLEDGYCNFSTKALNKILPFMREGIEEFDATLKAGYDPTKRVSKDGKIIELQKIPNLNPNELRNPIVQQMLSETFRVINKIIQKFGKPDMMRVELTRELKKPKSIREEIRSRSTQKSNLRQEYAEFLSKKLHRKIETKSPEIKKYELWLEMGCDDDSLNKLTDFIKNGRVKDQVKYSLWKESNRISPYSGNTISLSKLFSPEIEIEHIWPYSKTMNNEFSNLCLCERSINEEKGNLLPYEFFQRKGKAELEKFKKRISTFGDGKKYKFLAKEIPPDFLNSQINNTSYAARELAFRLEAVLPPINVNGVNKKRVQVVNGQATSTLRYLWNLNAILNYGDLDTKNRKDHRHHAIDALVVACTTPSLLHKLSTYSKFNINKFRLENSKIANSTPWDGYLGDAKESINNFIVSFRNNKNLIKTKLNRIKQTDLKKYPDGVSIQKSISIRGAMHEETLYGQVEIDGIKTFVTRKPISWFDKDSQLEKIVDKKVREVLLKRVKKYGSVKDAVKENPDDPILMYSKKGFKIPIKKIRIINNSENLVEIRHETKTFVETGNNYCIAIYKSPDSEKKKFKTVTFLEAVKNSLDKKPIIPKELDGSPLLFSLKQLDIVVRYKNHPDEIVWDDFNDLRKRLFRVKKFDVTGQIFLDYLFASKTEDKKDRNRLLLQLSPNTLNCIKINVNEIGEITKKEGLD